jgi:prepilin-type N-terminal cleavage/methylation domain-containing protein
MNRRTRGFTLIELIVVITIGVILTSMAVKGFGQASTALAARQGQNVFRGMVARTRAHAIESGTTVCMWVNVYSDYAFIYQGIQRVEFIDFGEEMAVDIQCSSGNIRLCMNPRGYADTKRTSFHSKLDVSFAAGGNVEAIEILPLGQIR